MYIHTIIICVPEFIFSPQIIYVASLNKNICYVLSSIWKKHDIAWEFTTRHLTSIIDGIKGWWKESTTVLSKKEHIHKKKKIAAFCMWLNQNVKKISILYCGIKESIMQEYNEIWENILCIHNVYSQQHFAKTSVNICMNVKREGSLPTCQYNL